MQSTRRNNFAEPTVESDSLNPKDLPDPVSGVREVREHIESLRQTLLDPSQESLHACLPVLEDSIHRMISIQAAAESARPEESTNETSELRGELVQLKQEIRIVARLIENGAAFYLHWTARFGAAEAGYVATGEAAPLTAAGSLSCRG